MKERFLIVITCVLISSCVSDVANRYYDAQHYPEKSPSQVEILRNKPMRDFIVIADFQSRGENPADLQSKAAKIGADAIIVTVLGGQYNRGDQWAGNDSMSNSYTHIVGTAIRYKNNLR